MPKESLCLKIPKSKGEKAIILANKLKIVDKGLKVERNQKFIYVPLIRSPSKDELDTLQNQILEYEITLRVFQEKKETSKTFMEYLEDRLPPYLLASLPRAIEFVGDIAIIEVPPELNNHKGIIGEAVMKAHKNVKTVLAKAGAVSGTYRLREYAVIAGEPKTSTIHKEWGCQYHVDLAKAYFSPRLSYEHSRVASLTKEGETVVDMFAGVGPFAVLIAKTRKNLRVYAVDINSHAVELLKKNARLNRVEDKIFPFLGDARDIAKAKLAGTADRVIMNLPEKAIEFVDAACMALKPEGGVIHFYSFVDSSTSLDSTKARFAEAVEKCGRKLAKILFSKFVRETAPYEWQAVIDAEIL